jgi:hypothetical protein
MVMDGAMDFWICFAFVWFVVSQVICDSLIFCYDSIMCWCFVLLFFIVKMLVIFVLDLMDVLWDNGSISWRTRF